jgi:hypothetical protein
MGQKVVGNDLSVGDGAHLNRPGVAVVTWDAPAQAAHIEWQGWADSAEFEATHEAGLRALRENRASRLLIDGRKGRVMKQSNQDWLTENLLPRAFAAGLRRVAVVMPTSALAMMNSEAMLARMRDETRLTFGYFATVEEATSWLSEPTKKIPGQFHPPT